MNEIWITLVLAGVLISIAIWIVERRRVKLWIRLLFGAIFILLSICTVYLASGPQVRGASHWYDESPVLEIILFILMVLGMAARYLTKAIEIRREKIAALQKQEKPFAPPSIEFDIWEFSYPLFLSVVTYGALISQVKEPILTLANCTLSFQTGFFWQTIVSARVTAKA